MPSPRLRRRLEPRPAVQDVGGAGEVAALTVAGGADDDVRVSVAIEIPGVGDGLAGAAMWVETPCAFGLAA